MYKWPTKGFSVYVLDLLISVPIFQAYGHRGKDGHQPRYVLYRAARCSASSIRVLNQL